MNGCWAKISTALAIGLTIVSTDPILAAGNPFLLVGHEGSQQPEGPERGDPRAMTQAEWQMISQRVSTNLYALGLQFGTSPQELAVLVPIFTQEYLRAFQFVLLQGGTKQQADILATQHIFAQIQQLAARTGAGDQGGDGCVYSRGGAMCSGRDGFLGFSFGR